jgi:pectate lyase
MLMGSTDRRNHVYDYYRNHWHHKHKGFANATGGAGQTIYKVTNRNTSGAGSFADAVSASNRLIVFEVGGTVDMGGTEIVLWSRSNITIAGQTAPPPGIKFKGLYLRLYGCSNIIISHVEFFHGLVGSTNADNLQTEENTRDFILDHCSAFWGRDESVSLSGYPSGGATLADLRATVTRRATISQCVIAEGVTSQRGTLVDDIKSEIFLWGNYWAHFSSRAPTFKAHGSAVMANNLTYNLGSNWIDIAQEPGYLYAFGFTTNPQPSGDLAAVGNVYRGGPQSGTPGGKISTTRVPQYEGVFTTTNVYEADNVAHTFNGTAITTQWVEGTAPYDGHTAEIVETAPLWPTGFVAVPHDHVWPLVQNHAGARPWNRDAHVARVLNHYRDLNGGTITDPSSVGGFGSYDSTSKTFVDADWDLATMIPLRKRALLND